MTHDSQEELTHYLIETGVLRTPAVIKAFRSVDRADFVAPESLSSAYADIPLPIGGGQTISQPTTVAFMLERLQAASGQRVLDLGSGSGWTTAMLAVIVGGKGRVFGAELLPDLVAFGQQNMVKYRFPWASIEQAVSGLGRPDQAPFDRILVSAAGEGLPKSLVDQIKVGGRMVIPLSNSIWQIDKLAETEIKKQEFPGFVFVPLLGS